MTPEQKTYIAYRLERARATLREAAMLLSQGSLHGAVNRLYYACFYAVSALLLSEGRSSSKHTGVRALFEKDWVKTGQVEVHMAHFYRDMFSHRQKGDYADLVVFDPADVRDWREKATAFVQVIAGLVEQQLRKDTEPPSE